MKRYKTLGILLLVLVLICTATFLTSRHEKKQEQIKSTGEPIVTIPEDTVTALSWEYEAGSGLSFHKEDGSWVYDDDTAFPVSEEKISGILSHFTSFGAVFAIDEVEDYGQYGLEKPQCTLTITADSGVTELKLGDYSQMDQQRYVDIGDGKVYLVSDDPMDFLDAALSSMVKNDTTPGFETVTGIQLSGSGSGEIVRMEDSGYSYSDDDMFFWKEDGSYLPLDKSAVTKFVNAITTLNLQGYVTYNVSEEELAEYGLDEPEKTIQVDYTNTDSETKKAVSGTFTVHIGQNRQELDAARQAEEKGETPDSVTKYVRVGDSQIIYPLSDSAYDTLTKDTYNDLRHREVFWGSLDDAARIDITLEGETHTLVSEKEKDGTLSWYFAEDISAETEETSEAAGETAVSNETDTVEAPDSVDLTDFTDALAALSADSFTEDTPTGKEELHLALTLNREDVQTVDMIFYRQDGTNCLAVVDGKPVSYVSRASVMKLVEAVQAFVL